MRIEARGLRRCSHVVTLGALVGACACTSTRDQPQKTPAAVFTPTVEEDAAAPTRDSSLAYVDSLSVGGTSIRIVELAAEALDSLATSGSAFSFSVPVAGGHDLLADVGAIVSRNGMSLVGSVRDHEASRVSLTFAGVHLSGVIQLGDTLIQIIPGASTIVNGRRVQQHFIVRQLPQKLPAELPPRQPPSSPTTSKDSPPTTSLDDSDCPTSQLDVLVLFSARAAPELDLPALRQAAALGIAQANQALSTSGVPHRLALADVGRLSAGTLSDVGDLDHDLDAVRASAVVRAKRQSARADLVSVWTGARSKDCGLGFVTVNLDQGAAYGLSVVPIHCAVALQQYSFAHETGHNLGMQHDVAHATSQGMFPFSFGFQAPDRSFRDIMSYDCDGGCPRELFYSTPRLKVYSRPAGIADRADNALTALRTACRVSQWDRSKL